MAFSERNNILKLVSPLVCQTPLGRLDARIQSLESYWHHHSAIAETGTIRKVRLTSIDDFKRLAEEFLQRRPNDFYPMEVTLDRRFLSDQDLQLLLQLAKNFVTLKFDPYACDSRIPFSKRKWDLPLLKTLKVRIPMLLVTLPWSQRFDFVATRRLIETLVKDGHRLESLWVQLPILPVNGNISHLTRLLDGVTHLKASGNARTLERVLLKSNVDKLTHLNLALSSEWRDDYGVMARIVRRLSDQLKSLKIKWVWGIYYCILQERMDHLEVLHISNVYIGSVNNAPLSGLVPYLRQLKIEGHDELLRYNLEKVINTGCQFNHLEKLELHGLNDCRRNVIPGLMELYDKTMTLTKLDLGFMSTSAAQATLPLIYSRLERLTHLAVDIRDYLHPTSRFDIVYLLTGTSGLGLAWNPTYWPIALQGKRDSITNLKHLKEFSFGITMRIWSSGRPFCVVPQSLFHAAFLQMPELQALKFVNWLVPNVCRDEWTRRGWTLNVTVDNRRHW